MDFTTRSGQPRTNAPAPQQQSASVAPAHNDNGKRQRRFSGHSWFKLASIILLFSGTILVVAVILFLNMGAPTHEAKYVNKDDYQAVFVNVTGTSGGQVYFGHVTDLSDNFVRLTNVFYIQNQSSSSSSSNNSYNLVKLGCELHGPEDAMVINRDQVFFWENLKSSGQVSQKIAEWYKNNPNGQNCSNSSTSSSTQQSSTTPNSSSSTNTTTGSNSTTTNNNTNSSSSTKNNSTTGNKQ